MKMLCRKILRELDAKEESFNSYRFEMLISMEDSFLERSLKLFPLKSPSTTFQGKLSQKEI